MNIESEEEIKIEYNETFSTDPLADNCEITLPNKNAQNDIIDDYLCENTIDNDCLPDSEIINWYKDIDSNGRYLCRYCDLKYSTIQTLRYHIRRKHFNEAQELKTKVANNKRKRKIKCHICDERFQSLKDLKTHFDTLHLTVFFNKSCFYCDATFCSEIEMTEHQLNIHGLIKKSQFLCTICGYRTAKKSHFNQHQNTHSSKKDMKCKYCDYSTNYLPNLNIHERIHTNNKPYKCDYKNCTYSCSAKSALRSHQLKHFPQENMLYCDKCSYKTVYRQTLKKHRESHIHRQYQFP